jgi:hypothetical protein
MFVRRFVPLLFVLLIVGFAGACGEDDEDQGTDTSSAGLLAALPTANELGHEPLNDYEWDNAIDLIVLGIFVPESTTAEDLASELDEAGFQAAAGAEFENPRQERNVRMAVVEFDSSEGAAEARDRLHEEDLKQPCAEACLVAPQDYQLDEIPESAAAHHVPTKGNLPSDVVPVEAFHAEFVVGSRLYVIQTDGSPDPGMEGEFARDVAKLYESASS